MATGNALTLADRSFSPGQLARYTIQPSSLPFASAACQAKARNSFDASLPSLIYPDCIKPGQLGRFEVGRVIARPWHGHDDGVVRKPDDKIFDFHLNFPRSSRSGSIVATKKGESKARLGEMSA